MKLFFTLLFIFSATAFGQYRVLDGSKVSGMSGYQNFVKNPSCQNGISFIASSIGAPAVTRDTTVKLDTATGTSCMVNTLVSGETWSWALGSVPFELSGGNCQVSFKHSGYPLLYKAYVTINGVKVSREIVPQASDITPKTEILTFPCGTDTTNPVVFTFESTSSLGAQVNLAKIEFGENQNIGTVAQAEYVGSIKVTGCAAAWVTSSSSYTQPGVTTGCVYTSTSSNITAPSTMLPGFNLSGPAGKYVITYTGGFGKAATASYSIAARFAAFSIFSPEEAFLSSGGTNAQFNNEFSGTLVTNTAVSNTPVVVQLKADGTNNAAIYGTTAIPGTFKVYRFPLDSEQALRLNAPSTMTDWVDGTCTSTWVANTTTTCKWRRVGGNAEIQFKAVTSGAPTATALIFSIPTQIPSIDSSKLIDIAGFIPGSTTSISDASPLAFYNGTSYYISSTTIGAYVLVSSATYTLPNQITQNTPITFASGDSVNMTVSVPIVGWSSPSTIMPLVKQSVVSPYDGVLNTLAFYISCNSGSSFMSYGGGISSVTNISSGNCTINFAPGTFSQVPICASTSFNCAAPAGAQCFIQGSTTPSTSSWTLRALSDASGISTSWGANVICVGPK